MADEKVYGIAESKSKVEVPRKSDVYSKDEVYAKSEAYAKSEVYNKTQADTKFLTHANGAPMNHQTSLDTYGLGTAEMFGHCMIVSTLDAPTGDQDGKALAASAGYVLKQYIDSQIAAVAAQIHLIPVGGVYWSFDFDGNPAQTLGYGVWEYCGSVNYSAIPSGQTQSAVFAYRRVS